MNKAALSKNQLRAVVIFSFSVFFIFYKYVLEVSPSVIGANIMRHYNIHATELGNIAACYYYAYFVMQIPMGLLLDRFGPRLVMSLSILLCVLGTGIMALSEQLVLFGVGRFMVGMGAAVSIIGAFKLLTLWFPARRFALLAGLTMSFGVLGAVFGGGPFSDLVLLVSWRHALLDLALVGLIFSILFFIMVRDNGPYVLKAAHSHQHVSAWQGLLRVVKCKQSWILSLYSGLSFAPITAFGGLWGEPYLQVTFGLNQHDAAQVASMVFLGFGLGSPLAGWLSDYIGRRKPCMIAGSLLSLGVLLWVVLSPGLSLAHLYILLFLFGFFTSGFIVSFSMMREINPIIYAAIALGLMNGFNAGFSAVADPILGHLLDVFHHGKAVLTPSAYDFASFHYAMFSLVAYVVLAVVVLLFIKETYCQQSE